MRQKRTENIIYMLAAILIIAWLIGFIGFNLGGTIHVLLVIAIIVVIISIVQRKRVF